MGAAEAAALLQYHRLLACAANIAPTLNQSENGRTTLRKPTRLGGRSGGESTLWAQLKLRPYSSPLIES
ncbi:hypothetical protein [Puniceicoccus vermicola]|uniref:Uncharacterized protein n=1 Tax=Puniceicoccus vermicola TaxID=388746 RepID=A0A7X1B1Y7_9BACT|nr:hypothetical protein [Puniceicoccus vermicola]MBC2604126.1 hypothetical protein [Puniceicoccus vermicola]